MQDLELIAQGAEARLYKGLYLGRMSLVKERFVKNYRHPELDARLTKDRIKAEARAIIRAKSAGKNRSMSAELALISPCYPSRNSNASPLPGGRGATQYLHGVRGKRRSAQGLYRREYFEKDGCG